MSHLHLNTRSSPSPSPSSSSSTSTNSTTSSLSPNPPPVPPFPSAILLNNCRSPIFAISPPPKGARSRKSTLKAGLSPNDIKSPTAAAASSSALPSFASSSSSSSASSSILPRNPSSASIATTVDSTSSTPAHSHTHTSSQPPLLVHSSTLEEESLQSQLLNDHEHPQQLRLFQPGRGVEMQQQRSERKEMSISIGGGDSSASTIPIIETSMITTTVVTSSSSTDDSSSIPIITDIPNIEFDEYATVFPPIAFVETPRHNANPFGLKLMSTEDSPSPDGGFFGSGSTHEELTPSSANSSASNNSLPVAPPRRLNMNLTSPMHFNSSTASRTHPTITTFSSPSSSTPNDLSNSNASISSNSSMSDSLTSSGHIALANFQATHAAAMNKQRERRGGRNAIMRGYGYNGIPSSSAGGGLLSSSSSSSSSRSKHRVNESYDVSSFGTLILDGFEIGSTGIQRTPSVPQYCDEEDEDDEEEITAATGPDEESSEITPSGNESSQQQQTHPSRSKNNSGLHITPSLAPPFSSYAASPLSAIASSPFTARSSTSSPALGTSSLGLPLGTSAPRRPSLVAQMLLQPPPDLIGSTANNTAESRAASASISSLTASPQSHHRSLLSTSSAIAASASLGVEFRLSDMVRIGDLGIGQNGTVVKALYLPTLRVVALKVSTITDKDERHQMLKELRTFNSCNSAHLLSFVGACFMEGRITMALEFMNRGSLDQVVKKHGALNLEMIRIITKQVMKGLKHLHSRRLIHRDIKPANILIDNELNCKISDFGLLKQLDDTHQMASTFVGCLREDQEVMLAGDGCGRKKTLRAGEVRVGMKLASDDENGYVTVLQACPDVSSLPTTNQYAQILHSDGTSYIVTTQPEHILTLMCCVEVKVVFDELSHTFAVRCFDTRDLKVKEWGRRRYRVSENQDILADIPPHYATIIRPTLHECEQALLSIFEHARLTDVKSLPHHAARSGDFLDIPIGKLLVAGERLWNSKNDGEELLRGIRRITDYSSSSLSSTSFTSVSITSITLLATSSPYAPFTVSGNGRYLLADGTLTHNTLMYLSPERIMGESFSYSSDIFSWGISMIYLVQGKLNLPKDYWALLNYIQSSSPSLDRTVYSPLLCDFIDACLIKDPAKRPSAVELLAHPFLASSTSKSMQSILQDWIASAKQPEEKELDCLVDAVCEYYYWSRKDVQEGKHLLGTPAATTLNTPQAAAATALISPLALSSSPASSTSSTSNLISPTPSSSSSAAQIKKTVFTLCELDLSRIALLASQNAWSFEIVKAAFVRRLMPRDNASVSPSPTPVAASSSSSSSIRIPSSIPSASTPIASSTTAPPHNHVLFNALSPQNKPSSSSRRNKSVTLDHDPMFNGEDDDDDDGYSASDDVANGKNGYSQAQMNSSPSSSSNASATTPQPRLPTSSDGAKKKKKKSKPSAITPTPALVDSSSSSDDTIYDDDDLNNDPQSSSSTSSASETSSPHTQAQKHHRRAASHACRKSYSGSTNFDSNLKIRDLLKTGFNQMTIAGTSSSAASASSSSPSLTFASASSLPNANPPVTHLERLAEDSD